VRRSWRSRCSRSGWRSWLAGLLCWASGSWRWRRWFAVGSAGSVDSVGSVGSVVVVWRFWLIFYWMKTRRD